MADPSLLPTQDQMSVFDALAEGVVWQSADGHIVAANAAAAPILGLTRDELMGRTSRDPRWYAVHEDGTPWPGREHPGMVALRTGQPQRDHIMGIMVPDKGRRWICIHAMPLRAEGSQQPTGVVASFADVTAHIELRHRIEAQTRELADLYNQAPCGYHTLDTQGRYSRINDTELAWLGLPRERVLGQLGPMDFLAEPSKPAFQHWFPQILAGKSIRDVEIEMVGAHGRHLHLQLSAEPVVDARGRVVGTRSVLHDITELHANRRALEQLNAEQAAMLDNELVGIARVRNRQISWVNRALGRIFGYEPGELLGRNSAMLFPDTAAFSAATTAVDGELQAGRGFVSRLELRRKDGSAVWVDCAGVNMAWPSGEAIWFVVDATDQHRHEALRIEAERLEAENRHLQQASRLHSSFLANMSHELRTPLSAVIGFTELLRRGLAAPGSEKFDRYLRQIESSGRHLLEMIDALLDTAQAESGQLVIHPQPLQARQVAGEVVAMLEPQARSRQVTVTLTAAPDLPQLHLDPLRLRQVLLNYIGNAIKFSHPGGHVEVRLVLEDRARLRIEVEDRGIGIAPADQALLFTRFHRVHGGLASSYAGAGIGLALVRLIVEAQGGAVGVRSELGHGSVFWATLPTEFRAAA